jgi:hypothetical protein
MSREPQITFSIQTSGSGAGDVPDTGPIVQTSDGGWILNPRSPFPLTLYGIDTQAARTIKERLDEAFSRGHYLAAQAIIPIVARSNLRCQEIDDYVAKFKPIYVRKIEELKRTSTEWGAASEKDREDLLTSFRQQATEALDVRPYCDLETLFEHEPSDATIDDALIDRYGFENLQLYLRYGSRLDKVRVVPADHHERKGFEKLVDLQLAKRGAEIHLPAVLDTLRLQDLNSLVGDLKEKAFTRKVKAVEFLLGLPDVKDRVGKVVSYRELFQLNPLSADFAAVDLIQVASAWKFAAEIGEVIAHTYMMGGHTVRDRTASDFIKGWELLATDDSCPYCKRAAAKTYSKASRPRIPLHIGCRCAVTAVV